MQVELHDGLRDAQKISATRVVVYDDYGNPIAVVVKVDGDRYVAATAANANFNKVLKAMGIDKTLVVTHLDSKKIKPLME